MNYNLWLRLGAMVLVLALTQGGLAQMSHLQIVQNFVQSMERRDLEALRSAMSERVVLEQPFPVYNLPSRYEGRDTPAGAMAYFAQARTNFSAIQFENKVFHEVAGGRFVFAEMWSRITVADGKPYRNRYIWRFELEGGRIVGILEYANPIWFAQRFGVPPAPSPVPGQP